MECILVFSKRIWEFLFRQQTKKRLAAGLHQDLLEKLTRVLPKPQAGFLGRERRVEKKKGDKRREGVDGKGKEAAIGILQSTALRESIA